MMPVVGLLNLFRDHPASVGETYPEHAYHAACFATLMLRASFACFVHSVFPWLFPTSGSRTVALLHDRMIANRTRLPAPGNTVAGSPDSQSEYVGQFTI
jgi:hypothetical protein